jgi:hypothetical protein
MILVKYFAAIFGDVPAVYAKPLERFFFSGAAVKTMRAVACSCLESVAWQFAKIFQQNFRSHRAAPTSVG